ncbi:hypothetical protein Gotur_018359 [Gossypium turneri]
MMMMMIVMMMVQYYYDPVGHSYHTKRFLTPCQSHEDVELEQERREKVMKNGEGLESVQKFTIPFLIFIILWRGDDGLMEMA